MASAPETFCSSKWADDSALVDYSLLSRLQKSKWAQYKAMVLTLGPSAIQMDKDTPFFTFGSCLGLLIDTKANEVSMKQEKIDKALFRIANVKASTRISKTVGLELLGSLRYVSLVLRPAQAFFQRIQRFVSRIARGRSKYVTAEVRDDLSRLEQALFIASLNATPFDTILRTTVPDVRVQMDACGKGSCAVDLTNKIGYTHCYAAKDILDNAAIAGLTPPWVSTFGTSWHGSNGFIIGTIMAEGRTNCSRSVLY